MEQEKSGKATAPEATAQVNSGPNQGSNEQLPPPPPPASPSNQATETQPITKTDPEKEKSNKNAPSPSDSPAQAVPADVKVQGYPAKYEPQRKLSG